MIKFDKDEFLNTMIYSTNDEYQTRHKVDKEIVEDIKVLQNEKQQLISFLKDNIKKLNNQIKIKEITQQSNFELLQEISELRTIILTYQEILDYVSKGGKDE